MAREFRYPIGGGSGGRHRPPKHSQIHPQRHPGLAEREERRIETPEGLPPAAYEASVFGRLDVRLQHAIASVGYAVPTPIQEKAMPDILDGRDLIGCAQTGTGKTAAFMLPVLNALMKIPSPSRPGHPRALVLSPTRELAAQTAENTALFSRFAPVSWAVVFGGVPQRPQEQALKRGADVVIATPGRLMDLMSQGVVYLDAVEYFVLDEADRMLDMGFFPDIRRIVSKIPPAGERQSLFFSATLGAKILHLAHELVNDPVQVMVEAEKPTADNIAQSVMFVEKPRKDALLQYLLETHPEWRKAIVFARTRHGADRVERRLKKSGEACVAIHSDKTQNQRLRALNAFKEGRVRVLVATDIASRGLDVPRVHAVINMELPAETESYVHRIGRTARAGESGIAVSFVAPEERSLLKTVERYLGSAIAVERDHPFHSEDAERLNGKSGEGLPQAPWIAPAVKSPKPGGGIWMKKNRKKAPSHTRHTNFQGRREPDFGQKRKDDE